MKREIKKETKSYIELCKTFENSGLEVLNIYYDEMTLGKIHVETTDNGDDTFFSLKNDLFFHYNLIIDRLSTDIDSDGENFLMFSLLKV